MLIASALLWSGLNLHAQLGPTITNQPASQTNLPGTSVSFSVAVNGIGPFTYQWQFNGANLPNNIITTVAGNGSGTYAGDGGGAIYASLSPVGVTFDAYGNLYIADIGNNRIRKVDTNGIIITVAGKSSAAYAGDGGAATNASLNSPAGMAFDVSGNLFIADWGNNRIRKVDTNGIITTVAGNGSATYAGDGGAATNASLYHPYGVAFDTVGNLFIADSSHNRIRKVDTNGIITTVAGNGGATYAGDGGAATNASLYYPESVAFDTVGNLFIADSRNNRIRKVDTNGIITTVAGNGSGNSAGDGGQATNASFSVSGVTFDAVGNLYIASTFNNRIRKVDTNDIITTVVGNGSLGYSGDGGAATNASLYNPIGVAFDASGNLFIADSGNYRIRKVLLYAGYPTFTLNNLGVFNAGNYTVVITSPYGSVTSLVATLAVPVPAVITSQPASQIVAVGSSPSFSVAVAGSGPFGYGWYFAGTNLVQSGTNNLLTLPNVQTNNTGNYTVVITNNYGSVTSQIARLTVALPPLVTSLSTSQTNLAGTTVSFSVAAVGIGPFTYQWQFTGTNLPNNIITTVAGNGSYGGYSGDGGAATSASLADPWGVIVDNVGNLLIADTLNQVIRKVDTNGIITTVAGIYGSYGYSGDGGPATNALLYGPACMVFDSAGNLFIAEFGNNSVRRVDTNGIITLLATNANLHGPRGMALDSAGNLFIGDFYNNCIRRVDTNGIITTVAGNGTAGYSGDGGPATNAFLFGPACMVFDSAGNLYFADQSNNRIRKVDTNEIITTVAGKGPIREPAGGNYSGDGGSATNASLSWPPGVTLDSMGNFFIADRNNNRIRKVDTNGIITTAAGNGTGWGYAGDGGAATNASVNIPEGVAFDASGNLYIADAGNNRIREVHFAGFPTFTLNNIGATNAGNYTVVVTSPYGSVTNLVATLTVIVPPQIIASGTNFGFTTNLTNQSGFGFNISGTVSQTIVVDGSTNLVNWMPLYTNIANGNPFYFFDPASTNFPGRFYRARLP